MTVRNRHRIVRTGKERGMRFYFMDGDTDDEKIKAWEDGIIQRLGVFGNLEIVGGGVYRVHGMKFVLDKVMGRLAEFREFFPDATMEFSNE